MIAQVSITATGQPPINMQQMVKTTLESFSTFVTETEEFLNSIRSGTEIRNALITMVDSEKTSLSGKRNEIQENIDQIANELSKREETTTSTFGSINYMMILLGLCFGLTVFLRFWQSESVISDRTLIEFGGMSFLLLAVIILASGNRIDGQTVGPLLGTIAGYIFGKSISTERHPNNNGRSDDTPTPAEPAENDAPTPAP